jgi:transposase
VPYSFHGDSGPAPHLALSSPAGTPDGSDEESDLGPLAGNRSESQQAEIAQGEYFRELLESNQEVDESIRPLLKLSRETIVRLQRTEYALISSLERDPLLRERLKNLRTVPGVGPITALTWALEIGDVSRFRSVKQAISYCGLCGDEKSSADKVLRKPISTQRNKHIQRVLVEAAKLGPKQSHELALVYEKEKQKGHANRATLAVARKMVAYLLVVDREGRAFVPAEDRTTTAA